MQLILLITSLSESSFKDKILNFQYTKELFMSKDSFILPIHICSYNARTQLEKRSGVGVQDYNIFGNCTLESLTQLQKSYSYDI